MRALALSVLIALSATSCTKVRSMFGDEGGEGDEGDKGSEAAESSKDACAEARKHEQANEYDKAREAYADCLATGLGHVDAHAAYQKILVLEEGDKGALAAYEKLLAKNKNVVSKFAQTRLLERDARIAKLGQIIKGDPEFAPAYYELSLDYSAARMGQRSLSDQAEEKKLLDAFLSRAKGKDFVKYFADYDKAEEQVKDAESRLAQLASIDLSVLDEPVTMTATPSNSGWMLHFQVAEPSTAVFYRLHDETDFTKIEGSMVTIPLQRMTTAVYIKYEDKGGVMRGPFELVHEPRSALGEFAKKALEMTKTSWVTLRDFDEKTLLYWTMLLMYRCGLESVEYGIDSMTPNLTYDPGECDPQNPYEITEEMSKDLSRIYIEVPRPTKFVSVRLLFHDGTKSKVEKFEM